MSGENALKLRVLDKLKKKDEEVVEKAPSEEVEERQEWSSGIDFFLSALGYAGKIIFSALYFLNRL